MGLATISSRDTSQSIAFLSPPGIARTYSGLDRITPSLARIRSAKACTRAGRGSASRSGEKTGRSASPEKTVTSCAGRASSATAVSSAVLVEARRALPEMARNLMCHVPCCARQAAL